MGKKDEQYYALNSQLNNNAAEQQRVNNSINSINARIESLKQAYNAIDSDKEMIKSMRGTLKGYPYIFEGSWKGLHADITFSSCDGGLLDTNYKRYIDSLDNIEDSINLEIARLRNERYGQERLLSGLVQTWNNVYAQLRNYFN